MKRAASIAVLVLAGCTQSGALFGADVCEPWVTDIPRSTAVDAVDLLVVVDSSSDLAAARASLAAELPRAIAALTSGDYDRDGDAERTAVSSVHVAVVIADMGTGEVTIPGCSPDRGADGRFVSDGCAAADGIFAFAGRTTEAEAAALDCATMPSSSDCAFTQPLDAMLRAISPSAPTPWTRDGYVPPIFADGGHGHGDGANAGFLRPSSVLAVMIVTNDDDCSAASASVYSNEASPLGLRCHDGAADLQPTHRFVDGLIGLRSDRTSLVFVVVAGIPAGRYVSSYDDALASPENQEAIDPERPDHLRPSCETDTREARPPRRLLEVARDLERYGAMTSFRSICDDSLAPSVDSLLASIARRLAPSCVDAVPDADGHLACEVVLELSAWSDVDCEDLSLTSGGLESLDENLRLCVVPHVEPGSAGPGWLETDAPECPGSIMLVGIELPSSARAVLHCYEPARLSPTDERSCDPATDVLAGGGTCAELGLACDPFALRCGAPCGSDADCTSGHCDLQSAAEVFPRLRPARLSELDRRAFCAVSSSCSR